MCTMLRPAFTSMVPQLQVIAKRPSDAIRRHQVLPAGERIAFIVWRAISSGILWWSISTRAPFLSVLAMRIFCDASCPMSRALTNGRFGTHAFALMQNRHKHKRVSVDHSANTSTTSPLATSKSASFDVVFNVTGLVHGLVASASGRVGSGAHSNDPDSGSFVVRFHYDWAPLVCMAFCDCVSKRV